LAAARLLGENAAPGVAHALLCNRTTTSSGGGGNPMRHVILVLCALTACTKVESSSIKTSGMSAALEVSANGDGTAVASAQLFVDDSLTDRVDLSSGDTLVASSGIASQTMQRSNVLNVVSYQATFQGLDTGGATFTIALRRASDTSAPNSTCTMPAPFAISAPAGSTSSSRGADLAVAYGPGGTGDSMTWQATGDCIKSTGTQYLTGDPGAFTIAKGTLVPVDAQHASMSCPVSIVVYRTRKGTLDPAYGHGGNIFAQQTRSVAFTSTP
jgi:hypothetical protein